MLDYKVLMNFIEDLFLSYSFKKSKVSFVRKVNDIVQILEVQKYTFKIEGNNVFTINMGIIIPDTFLKVFGRATTPSVSEGVVYFNIGELINDFNGRVINKHWVLKDEDTLKSELKDVFEEKVMPFFDSINTPHAIVEFVKHNKIVSKSTNSIKMQLDSIGI